MPKFVSAPAAVTIDVGDLTDIHPPDKVTVGRRAAAVMNAVQAGDNYAADGYPPIEARSGEHGVVVVMASDDFVVVEAARPSSFQVCKADEVCACADAPICNLYTGDGLPVCPFRVAISK